jgi:hypothetical protein
MMQKLQSSLAASVADMRAAKTATTKAKRIVREDCDRSMSSDESEGARRKMPCLYVLYAVLYVGELDPPEIRSWTDILAIPAIPDDCHNLRCEARFDCNLAWNKISPPAEAMSTGNSAWSRISLRGANSQQRTDKLSPWGYQYRQ